LPPIQLLAEESSALKEMTGLALEALREAEARAFKAA
jgi:hypothetical protein